MNGYITIDKKIIDWEWYKSHNEMILFIHLLLICNYESKTWRGIKIKRGQLVTSYQSLSTQTGLSIRSVRTAINNLVSTGELTSKPTNLYSLVTICKYDDYQNKNNKTDTPTDRPIDKPIDKRTAKRIDKPTDKRTDTPTDNNISNTKGPQKTASETAVFVAPTFNQIRSYFDEKRLFESNPVKFYDEFKEKLTANWKQDAINYANGKR